MKNFINLSDIDKKDLRKIIDQAKKQKLEKNSIVGAGSVITKKVRRKSLALTRSLQTEVKNYKRKRK